jgi:hypothetical protein
LKIRVRQGRKSDPRKPDEKPSGRGGSKGGTHCTQQGFLTFIRRQVPAGRVSSMFKRKRKVASHQIGCGYLFGTGFILLILFVLNNAIVRALFSANIQETDERLFQAAQFLLPIGMLLVEYWILDGMVDSFRNFRAQDEEHFR